MRPLVLLPTAPEWQKAALCPQTDPEAFYPDKGGSPAAAKRVCKRCDVRDDCLRDAIENDERFGVWGGMTRNERKRHAKRRAAQTEAKAA